MILLTGASGFLGQIINSHICRYYDVFTLSRNGAKLNLDLSKATPRFSNKFDLVIHSAGLAHVLKNSANPQDFHSVNVVGTENLLKGLDLSGIPVKFVFVSSVSVYGINSGYLINESYDLQPIDAYGSSKMAAEKLVLNWCKRNNVICTVLRLPLVVDLNPPGNLGAMIKGIRKGYYFNIAGGSAKKSMVLASDVAKYILKASEIGGIFNLTDGYHPSFYELSETIAHQLGKSDPKNVPYWLADLVARIGDLFGDKAPLNSPKLYKITSDLTFDDSKAREAFGWDPTSVLEGFRIND